MQHSGPSKRLLENPARLRNRIIVGALFVLLIVNVGYVYDTVETAAETTNLVGVSNFVLDVHSINRNLEERIAQAPATSLPIDPTNPIPDRVAFLKLLDKDLTFGLVQPTVLRLVMADGVSDLSYGISDTGQQKITEFLDAIQANGRAKDFYLSPLPQTDSLRHIIDIDLVRYFVAASPLLESAGMLLVVRKSNTHEITNVRAIKRALVFAGSVFWLGIWSAII